MDISAISDIAFTSVFAPPPLSVSVTRIDSFRVRVHGLLSTPGERSRSADYHLIGYVCMSGKHDSNHIMLIHAAAEHVVACGAILAVGNG
ncbi:hypothetical protein [Nonomuraea sp. GTA35]|uniref:hypothetical protein n=1 Tax=Nonomuraea sp. GTA35 TaxID=1676746 RepID=UPI0035C11F2D